jgi:hypothetical protein
MCSSPERYVAIGYELKQTATSVFAFHLDDGRVSVLTTNLATILQLCNSDCSLDDHLDYIASAISGIPKDAIATDLQRLLQLGLLTRSDWPLKSPDVAVIRSTIETLVVPTAGRPERLRNCLSSYIGHTQHHRRAIRIVVADGSRTTAVSAAVADAVSEMRFRADIHLITHVDQCRFKTRAATLGIAPDMLDFLLLADTDRFAAGASRNRLLLATAGHCALTVDDDTRCTVWGRQEDEATGMFVGHIDVRELWPFEDRASALDVEDISDEVDLIAEHERLLGSSLPYLRRVWSNRAALELSCGHIRDSFERSGSRARVRATWSGIAGDSGTYCPYSMVLTGGVLTQLFAHSGEASRVALTSREVRRRVRSPVVSDSAWIMGYCAAIDGSELLPPFNPIGRNEDGLFGHTLRLCDPDAFIGQVPYGVIHDSDKGSAYAPEGLVSARQVRIAEVIYLLAKPWASSCLVKGTAERMVSLGAHLAELGRADYHEFRLYLARVVMEAKLATIARCQQLVSQQSLPAHWVCVLQEFCLALEESLRAPYYFVPIEYRSLEGPEFGTPAVQEHVRLYGDSLQAWPYLWDLARESSFGS